MHAHANMYMCAYVHAYAYTFADTYLYASIFIRICCPRSSPQLFHMHAAAFLAQGPWFKITGARMLPAWAQRSQSTGCSSASSSPSWAARSRLLKRPACAQLSPAKKARRKRAWDSLEDLRSKLEKAMLPVWWIALLLEAAGPALKLSVVTGLEVFSGMGELSSAFALLVGPFLTFEILNDDAEDIMWRSGVMILLEKFLSIAFEGLLWLGTPCKSWVALSRSFTHRSLIQPSGPDKHHTSQRQCDYLDGHNSIAELTALFIRSAAALGIYVIVEQPVSSLLFHYEAMLKALAAVDAHAISFEMSAFEGESPKPLLLKGTAPCLQTFREVFLLRKGMASKTTMRLTRTTTNASGKQQFTGKSRELTASSGYTKCMGTAMALCFLGRSCSEVVAAIS